MLNNVFKNDMSGDKLETRCVSSRLCEYYVNLWRPFAYDAPTNILSMQASCIIDSRTTYIN